MVTFGLVTEGHTDQVVIENILNGYAEFPSRKYTPKKSAVGAVISCGCEKRLFN